MTPAEHAQILEELAQRCQNLTGPCRETDGDIAYALALHPQGWRRGVAEASATAIWFNDKTGQSWSAPSVTVSIDDATALAPNDLYIEVVQKVGLWDVELNHPEELKTYRGRAKAEARARLAASLRARAAQAPAVAAGESESQPSSTHRSK